MHFLFCRSSFLGRFFFRYVCCLVQVKGGTTRTSRVFRFRFAIRNGTSVFRRLSDVRFYGRRAFRLINVHNGSFNQRQPRHSKTRRACLCSFFTYRLRYFLSSTYRETRNCGRMINVVTVGFLRTGLVLFCLLMFNLRASIILFRFFQFRFR